MQHGMTVRTHRAQILNGINFVFCIMCRNWRQMMHMNKTCANTAKDLTEFETANCASCAVMVDTFGPGVWIALVAIAGNGLARTFPVGILDCISLERTVINKTGALNVGLPEQF